MIHRRPLNRTSSRPSLSRWSSRRATCCAWSVLCTSVAWLDAGLAARARAGPGHGGGRVAGDPGKLVHGAGLSAPVRGRCGSRLRWLIFLAALVPWLVGLGVAVSVMLIAFLGVRIAYS